MALRMLPSTVSSQLLPRLPLSSHSRLFPRWNFFLQGLPVMSFSIAKPISFALNIPGLLSDIWDSVLRAAPKKKVSHMKRRHRQKAGKALQDLKNLNTCPACGGIKRAHTLCQHCVEDVKKQWREAPMS